MKATRQHYPGSLERLQNLATRMVIVASLLSLPFAHAAEREEGITTTVRPGVPTSLVVFASAGGAPGADSAWPEPPPNRTKADPPVEPLDRDEFLGQVEASRSTRGFSEHVDPFSGSLHLNMVDFVLPGNGGLDIVVEHYYSSQVWNRVDDPLLARHSASADQSGRLGENGWQLHMGKLMNPYPGLDQYTTLIMPDGSTHPLYNRDGHEGEKITPEGWVYSVSGSVHTVQTTTGLKYLFDAAAPGADYTYLGMKDTVNPITIIQCTRIEDLIGNAIVIEYSDLPNFPAYMSKLDRISFDDPNDLREVVFSYYTDRNIIKDVQLRNNGTAIETVTFTYRGYFQAYHPQFPFIEWLYVNVLGNVTYTTTGDWPAEEIINPWTFTYYDEEPPGTPLTEGLRLIKEVISPRIGKLTYTWGAEVMETGSQSCGGVSFLTLEMRQSAVAIDQLPGGEIIYEDEATTNYTYTNPGEEDATTNVVTTDSQTSAVLFTEEHVFHGWGPYVSFDPTLWKVGRPKSSTTVIKDDAGEDLETVTTSTVWEQGSQISADSRWSSLWFGCGSSRNFGPQTYVKPTTVTRVVERHDSIPDPPPDPPPNPDGYTTTSSLFDDWGNVGRIDESSSDGLLRETYFTYWQEPTNNIRVGHVQGLDADPGGTQCYQYDALGRVEHSFSNPQTDAVAACTPADVIVGARQIDYVYGPDGNLQTQTEQSVPNNRVTTHLNYVFGSPTETTVATGTGTDIHYCRDYRPRGMLSWETDGRGCSDDFKTVYDYDFLGRRTSVDPPLSDPIIYSYPLRDSHVAYVTRGDRRFEYRYDRIGSGHLTDIYKHIGATPVITHLFAVTNDALGRRRHVQQRWNARLGDTFLYDPLGRPTTITHPDTPTTQVTIDYAGSTVTATDEKLHTTVYDYEAFGDPRDRRLASLVDAGSNTTTYGYDSVFGNLETVTAPIAQGDRSFTYYSGTTDCNNGFLSGEIHPESGTTSYEYNCLGNITSRTRPGPETTTYDFDYAGRLTDINYPGTASDVDIGYDGASRRTTLSNDHASSTIGYDDAGRLETVTQSIVGGPQGQVTWYTYDTLDRLHTMTYPTARVVTYGWNDDNWLQSLSGEEGSEVEYLPSISYHTTGAPDLVTFANGIATDHWIDDRNRLVGITATGLMHIGIGYDGASNLETWTDSYYPGKNRSFGYDELDRLTSATAPGLWGSLGFTYDDLGNRETRTLNDDTTDYVYDHSTNRLGMLSGAEDAEFLYDDIGRLAIEVRGPGDEIFADGFESGDTSAWGGGTAKRAKASSPILAYTFDSADQLTRVERGAQTLGEYAYDGDGLRVSKTVEGETVYYLRDPNGNTLAEYNQDSNLVAEYIYAGSRQVAKVEPDGQGGDDVSFFHPDPLGTALYITDEAGSVTWSGDYYPFGAEYSSVGTADRYRFTQHELDTNTVLVYAKARYYHPAIGRFISTDPVGGDQSSSQSWNRYAYVENNPLNMVDPDGQLANWAVGALIGAAIGGGGELIRQAVAGEDINIRNIGAAAAGGLVSGAIAGGTFGASLIAQAGVRGAVIAGSVSNVAGGAVQRELDSSQDTVALSDAMFIDAAVGGVGGGLGHTVETAARTAQSGQINSLQQSIQRRSGIVEGRLSRGSPAMSAGQKLARDQARLAAVETTTETAGTVAGTVSTNAAAPIVIQSTNRQLEDVP